MVTVRSQGASLNVQEWGDPGSQSWENFCELISKVKIANIANFLG